MKPLKYLNHYHEHTKAQVHKLIEEDKLKAHLLSKYKVPHAEELNKS